MQTHTSPENRTPGLASVSESEDGIRNLKASESVVAAFQAAGFPSPGGELAAIISNYVKSETRGIPLSQLANMTPGSGPLSTSAAAGVNQYLAGLTPQQREAVKAGVNPLDQAAMQKFNMMLGAGGVFGGHSREGGLAGNNGGRYASLREGQISAEAAGSVALASSYNSLLKEGYKAAELKAIMPYARELGWHDKQAVRALADTGPEGGELAKRWNNAKKRGDKEGMRAAEDEAKRRAKEGKTPRERRGYEWMQKKFQKSKLSTEAALESGERPEQPNAALAAAAPQAIKAGEVRPDAVAASGLLSLGDLATPSATASTTPTAPPPAGPSTAATASATATPAAQPQTSATKDDGQNKVVAKVEPPKRLPAPSLA